MLILARFIEAWISGQGRVTVEEMQGVPHHMLDILDIHEMYGVGEFAPEARRIIADISARGKLPILSGGTRTFIDAVIGNFTIPEVPADWEYRDELEAEKETKPSGKSSMPLILTMRASSILGTIATSSEALKSGKPQDTKESARTKTESPYDFLRITPYNGDREKLYQKINQRVEQMFHSGLIEEVSNLLGDHNPADEDILFFCRVWML